MRQTPIALAMACAFPVPLWAQTTPATETLPEVRVSAQAEQPLPRATGQLNAKQLLPRRASTSDTATLLQDIPGVSLYSAGGTSSLPVLHGLADERLRIRVDGMDLMAACPNHMNPPLSYLDPTQVGTVQVYAGIAPVSAGGDSIGGSIVVSSPAPVFALPGQGLLTQGEVGTYYRSNGHAQGGHVAATLASDTLSLSVRSSTAQADNYQAGGDFKTSTATGRPGHTLPLDEVGSTAYETRNHALNLAYKDGPHLLELKVGAQELPYQLYPNQRMDMLGNQQSSVNLRYQGREDWGWWELRAYHEAVDHAMDFGDDKQLQYGTATGMPMRTASQTTGLTGQATVALSPSDWLSMGGEFQSFKLDDWWSPSGTGMMSPNTFWNIREGQRDRAALWGEWEQTHSPQWTTLLGLRYERVSSNTGTVQGYANTNGMGMMTSNQLRDSSGFNAQDRQRHDDNLNLTALARYRVDATQALEFGFAHKTRSPSLYERYIWSTWAMAAIMNNVVGDGNGYVGNPNLKPEQANTWSLTYAAQAPDGAWGFQATPYYTEVADYIDAVKTATWVPQQFNVLQYANQSARLYGVDVSGHLPLGQTSVGQWGLKALLSYTHGENRDMGDALYNIMPLHAKLTLTHQSGGWDNALEWVMVQGKHDTSGVRNEVATAGYNLVNLRLSHSWKQVRLDVGVDNLLDKSYRLPLGGAYTGQGSTMSINGVPWGVAVPGMGRSLYAGINVQF